MEKFLDECEDEIKNWVEEQPDYQKEGCVEEKIEGARVEEQVKQGKDQLSQSAKEEFERYHREYALKRFEGKESVRTFGTDSRIPQTLRELPSAFALLFCNTQEKLETLQPTIMEARRLGYLAHNLQWKLLEKMPAYEIWQIPWPVLGLATCAADIDNVSVWAWFSSVRSPKNWMECLRREYQRWEAQIENFKRMTSNVSPTSKVQATYLEMAMKAKDVIGSVFTELYNSKEYQEKLANGYFDGFEFESI